MFYIEPVTFRLDPFFLKPWLSWITQMMSPATSAGIEFGFASSPDLCLAMRESQSSSGCKLYPVSPRKLLEPFSFDRHDYALDLYGRSCALNTSLQNRLLEIGEYFRPDKVICWTQNRYVEDIFANRVLFWEASPFPRAGKSISFFMDPYGHQRNSLPNLYKDRILGLPLSAAHVAQVHDLWQERVVAPLYADNQTPKLVDWLASISRGKKIALLALQPADWLTYEASWRSVAIDQFIMQCAADVPQDWIMIPVLHPDQSLPLAMRAAIMSEFPNIYFPPNAMSVGTSELFLPHVDAVISISSSLSTQAVFHGKTSISLGDTQFGSFTKNLVQDIDQVQPISFPMAAALLAFLSNRYSHPLQTCLNVPGYLERTIEALAGNAEIYFDLTEWRPSRLAEFL